jgi:hypothetical protein
MVQYKLLERFWTSGIGTSTFAVVLRMRWNNRNLNTCYDRSSKGASWAKVTTIFFAFSRFWNITSPEHFLNHLRMKYFWYELYSWKESSFIRKVFTQPDIWCNATWSEPISLVPLFVCCLLVRIMFFLSFTIRWHHALT